jgi:putative hydrolase of the HAD superfamily
MQQLPRGILVDMDDTILALRRRPRAIWEHVLGEFAAELGMLGAELVIAGIDAQSLKWNDPAWNAHWRMRIQEARRLIVAGAFAELAAAGQPIPAAAVGDAIADRFAELREAELCLFPGACEALDRLKELGVRLALITNGAAEPQRAKVVRFALEHRFDHVQIEGEHGFGKPDERAYMHAMERLGTTAGDTWIVGDNLEWEVEAPQRLGIHAIWYDGYGTGLPADSRVRPDRIIRSLTELLPSR